MGGQLDRNFLPGSLPHKFILIVTSIICFVVNKFLFLCLSLSLSAERAASVTSSATGWRGIVLVLRERSELRRSVQFVCCEHAFTAASLLGNYD